MITRTAFETLLKEYDAKQLKAAADLRARKEAMEREIPRLAEIDREVAHLSVSEAISRITGKADPSGREKLSALREEKKALLEQAGYTEADLQPRYQCSRCKDTGYIGSQFCPCLKERLTDILYDQSNIKEVLKEENFKTFSFRYYPEGEASDLAKAAVAKAQDFIENFDASEDNLFISGATGVGKTFLTNCIAKELLDRGYFTIYLSAIRLFDILSEATFRSSRSDREDTSADFICRHIYDCDLLIIDDLGTEMINSFTTAQLFHCINERIIRKKHTIISTNLSLKQLQENYSERIFSRIANKYSFIRLIGNDIRMIKKLEEK